MTKIFYFKYTRVLLFLLASILAAGSSLLFAQEQDALEYEVSVKALQVPFVAVDSSGNPVYDLKSDELELMVNKKKVNILYLYSLALADTELEDTGKAGAETPPPAGAKVKETGLKRPGLKKPTRLKFIIVDALFNSAKGMQHAKMVARELVEKAAPEDRFILLEIQLGGLKYIAGPEPANEELLRSIDKLRRNPQKLNWWNRPEGARGDPMSMQGYLYEEGMKHARRNTVLMYLDTFDQFKNALKTLEGPKITYLLSEGFRSMVHDDEYSFESRRQSVRGSGAFSYQGFEEKMVKEVYDGGSVLKRVNMRGLRPNNVAAVSGWLTRSTAAYYELFFDPGKKIGKNMKIKIKCKRKGVRIDAVGHKEKEKPYQKMNRVQRKLFAVSVVTGRSYSGMIGRVRRGDFTIMQKQATGGETHIKVEVEFPEEMWDRKVDIYTLRFDEKYKDVDVAVRSSVADVKAVIALSTKKEKKILYVVIVDPETTSCIYSRVN